MGITICKLRVCDLLVLMEDQKRFLLVEDDPKDIELTLTALFEHNLVNSGMP